MGSILDLTPVTEPASPYQKKLGSLRKINVGAEASVALSGLQVRQGSNRESKISPQLTYLYSWYYLIPNVN
jgi:hypothetical protein